MYITGVHGLLIWLLLILKRHRIVYNHETSPKTGRIYTRDELFDAEFILEDDLSISDDLASWDG